MENIICLKLLMTQNWWALSLHRTLYIILRLSVPPNFSENFYTHSVDGLCHQRDFTFESQDSTPMTTVDWISTEHLTQEKQIYGHVNGLSDFGERNQTKGKKKTKKKKKPSSELSHHSGPGLALISFPPFLQPRCSIFPWIQWELNSFPNPL